MSAFRAPFLRYRADKFPFRMLDDLDRSVDRTDSKLSDAMRKMRKFVREIEGQSVALC